MCRHLNLALEFLVAVACVVGLAATACAVWSLDSPADQEEIDMHATFYATGQSVDSPEGSTCNSILYTYGDESNPPDSWFGALLQSRQGTADGMGQWSTPTDAANLYDPSGLTNNRWPEVASTTVSWDMAMKVTRLGSTIATARYDVTPDPE